MRQYDDYRTAEDIQNDWENNPRWAGIERSYSATDVEKLQGSLLLEYTLARVGSELFFQMLMEMKIIRTFGAYTGAMAIEMVRAGVPAIYLSGWQVAADANLAAQVYPDQSVYPMNSAPAAVERLNNALIRADQIEHMNGKHDINWFVPIMADAEAGFGGPVHMFELTKAFIKAGASGIHIEDQVAAEKKCGHLGGKVLVSEGKAIKQLNAARMAADVSNVPLVIMARTDAYSATYLESDSDEHDHEFLTGERTPEGYYVLDQEKGLEYAIKRSLAYAPYADVLWWETSEPNLQQAKVFADAIHAQYPDKVLGYNCSPSFNWGKYSPEDVAKFQDELAEMGYVFQFITLAGWHIVNFRIFEFAQQYMDLGMTAYVDLIQRPEFQAVNDGYTAVKHQQEVGVGYFDGVVTAVGKTSTVALKGSTEEDQF